MSKVSPAPNDTENVKIKTNDWYASGKEIDEKCEDMLGSHEWQKANPLTYDGLVTRLEMMKEIGLPSMRVISAGKLKELGRIPRSNEGYQEDLLEAVKRGGKDCNNAPRSIVVFFSHCWLRPNWCQTLEKDLYWNTPERNEAEAAGYTVGDPDGFRHEKALALIELIDWLKRMRQNFYRKPPQVNLNFKDITFDVYEIFIWIDWCCVDQSNPGPDMAALPANVAVSTMLIAAWNDVYERRGWCQVELMMANAFMASGNRILVLEDGFIDRGQPKLVLRFVKLRDPCNKDQCLLTKESDREIIKKLSLIASKSTVFSCLGAAKMYLTQSLFWGFVHVVTGFGGLGFFYWLNSRNVNPGKGKIVKLTPSSCFSW